jgi:integrase
MRGNITRRGKSSWRLKYDVGTGSERQIAYVTVRGTRKQAEAELAKRLTELAEGHYVPPTVETVESYARHWIADIAPTSRAAITIERYQTLLRAHIIPGLGAIELQKLDGMSIDRFYASRREMGLASLTLHHIHSLLGQILNSAVKAKKLVRSPVGDIQAKPKAKRRDKIEVLNEAELTALLDHLRGHWLYIPVLLAASTGMRRGEVLGLRWHDVDLSRGTLEVTQQLKWSAASST